MKAMMNTATIVGRIVRVEYREDKNSNKYPVVTIAHDTKNGETQFITLEGFIKAGIEVEKTPYNYLTKGRPVEFTYHIQRRNSDKRLRLVINTINLNYQLEVETENGEVVEQTATAEAPVEKVTEENPFEPTEEMLMNM